MAYVRCPKCHSDQVHPWYKDNKVTLRCSECKLSTQPADTLIEANKVWDTSVAEFTKYKEEACNARKRAKVDTRTQIQ